MERGLLNGEFPEGMSYANVNDAARGNAGHHWQGLPQPERFHRGYGDWRGFVRYAIS